VKTTAAAAVAKMMKINVKRLDHMQLCIPPGADERAREFYGGVLGLREIEKPEQLRERGGLWFEIADIQLHIGVESDQSKSKRHPAFEVENIKGIRSYLEQSGVRTKDETPLAGLERFSFFDPFDNRIEFLEREQR
jgi:catechol 2,3-dioxygenase-like lactoylglutathione lyase family enzyme